MARGRTITNFGQAFTPLVLSGGVTAAPPVVVPIPLTLRERVTALELEDRTASLGLRERVTAFTLRDIE